jgi:two-component system chemotaxis response regulator CheY
MAPITPRLPQECDATSLKLDMTMNSSAVEVLKLDAVLDLTAAEEFLDTLRQRVQGAASVYLDASAVERLTLPFMQIIMAAVKSGHRVGVENPSPEFVSAFADLGLEWPRAEPRPQAAPKQAAPEQVAADPPPPPAETAPATPSSDVAMSRRILTIDDSKTIRDMLRMTLAPAGYEILQAVDGQDGVEVMDRETVDLVITDINMPRMNGYEVVRHLRARLELKGLPILVLTTESDGDKKNLAREAGATGWMVKPFDPDRLLETVRKVIPRD